MRVKRADFESAKEDLELSESNLETIEKSKDEHTEEGRKLQPTPANSLQK